MKLFKAFLAFALPVASTFAEPISEKTQQRIDQIHQTWGHRKESRSRQIIEMPFRIVDNVVSVVFESSLGNMGSNIPKSLLSAAQANKDQFYGQASSTPLNPLMTLNAALDDAIYLPSALARAHQQRSDRVHVCSVNLVSSLATRNQSNLGGLSHLAPINPALHVGYLVDGAYDSSDQGGGQQMIKVGFDTYSATCRRTYRDTHVSESLSISRLNCFEKTNRIKTYSLFLANCASYTDRSLENSGLSYSGLPNAGLGTLFQNRKILDEEAAGVQQFCSAQEASFLEFLLSLETGEADILYLPDLQLITADMALQMIVSAGRSKSENSRDIVKVLLKDVRLEELFSPYYSSEARNQIKAELVTNLVEIMGFIDAEALRWMRSEFIDSVDVYESLLKTPVRVYKRATRRGVGIAREQMPLKTILKQHPAFSYLP